MATTCNISGKDIMSNSVVICSGPPAVYQMRPKKEKFGTLTKITVGERNPDTTNKTILLVGEKGAGKSTLINALVNYTMGVKWEDEVWLQIVEDEKRSQTESQTSDVIVYEIFDFENKTLPYSLTIIDTPGYGDTRGTEHDDIISQRLLELFESEDGVHEVHAVGLVMKVTDNQSSNRMKYMFDSVISLFGRKMEKNIAVLITHSDGMPPTKLLKALEDTNIRFAKKKNGQPGYFTFNNQQNIERTEENDFGLETAWRITQRGMSEFKAFLRETTPVKPEAASDVLTECIRLTASIQNLQDRIKFTEVKEREMKQTQEALKKHEGEIRINEQLPAFDAEVYKHKESITKAAVICTVCEENCHYPGCTVPLNHCEVFKDGFCTSCSKKCLASVHVKEKSRYVTRVKKIEKKQNNESECENKSSLLENLEKEMNQLAAEKSRLLDESYQRLVTLQQNVNSVSTYVHLDFLIEKMKEKRDTEKVQKLEEMRCVKSEGTRSALQDKTSVITSPHEDIILNSFLIRSGSPSVYQLRPKKEKLGTLTRMTVGEKNPNTSNKTILFVGETGAGKSTLINALINYTMGVKWEDEVWFQIVEDEKRSQTESQTSDVIVYEIFGFEDKTLPYSLTIIDTPGYGDTRGTEHDDIISQRLLDLFGSEDGVHELSSVGLVVMASDKRLSDRLMYVFNSMMSLFGKTVKEQIVALITHSDGRKPENVLQAFKDAKIKCAKNEKNEPVHFLFNNCQHEERTEEDEASLKQSWHTAQKGIGHLTELLGKSRSQPLMTTVEVLKKRVRLRACIQNLQERIELVDKQQTEIKQTEDAVKQNEEKMKKNENFITVVNEVYKDYEEIKSKWWPFSLYYGQATCCTVCEENCHYPGCTMAKRPEDCWVMKNGSCTVCTKKCPASDHRTEKKKYETKEKRVQRTSEEMKIKYEKNKSESEKKLSLLENLKKEMTRLTTEKSQLLDESFQHVVNLEKIALNIDSVSTLVHLDFLIEKMKEKGDTEKVQKLEEMKSRVDERIRAAYWYKLAQIPSAIKNIGKSLLGHK